MITISFYLFLENQLYFAFVIAIQFESFLSKWDYYFLETVKVNLSIGLGDFECSFQIHFSILTNSMGYSIQISIISEHNSLVGRYMAFQVD